MSAQAEAEWEWKWRGSEVLYGVLWSSVCPAGYGRRMTRVGRRSFNPVVPHSCLYLHCISLPPCLSPSLPVCLPPPFSEEILASAARPPATPLWAATVERCTVTWETCLWAGPLLESHSGDTRLPRVMIRLSLKVEGLGKGQIHLSVTCTCTCTCLLLSSFLLISH